MLTFIEHLRERYDEVINHTPPRLPRHDELVQQRDSLLIMEVALRRQAWLEASQDRPLQIAVIGPTQVGKSSLTNLLLDRELAGVSPLAGYTQHLQGFAVNLSEDAVTEVAQQLPHLQQVARDALSSEVLDAFSIQSVTDEGEDALLVWDTPDFDSITAASYRHNVLRIAALADMLVMVVSKDKYADLTVWKTLETLAPLSQPTLLMLNKMTTDAEALVTDDVQKRLASAGLIEESLGVYTLPLVKADEQHRLQQAVTVVRERLLQAEPLKAKAWQASCDRMAAKHWQQWLAPVRAEIEQQQQWQQIVDEQIASAMSQYERDFLANPKRYDALQRTLVRLLMLLEVPGVAQPIQQVRQVVTWPLRKLMSLGRDMVQGERASEWKDYGNEPDVLMQIMEHVLLQARSAIREQVQTNDSVWWDTVDQHVRQQEVAIKEAFQARVISYHEAFEEQINDAAESLYEKLKEQPAVLNSLRATRATADAAGIAFAINTGGVGLSDFILAPAVLSLTSMLAEGALGSYMTHIESDLKQQQGALVQEQIFDQQLAQPLSQIANERDQHALFGISADQIDKIQERLSIA